MNYIDDVLFRYECLESCEKEIRQATKMICDMYKNSGKLLLCGNGGSAADCEHISGELLKGFLLNRTPKDNELNLESDILLKLQKGIAAIPLPSFISASTAFSNDMDPKFCFAQLVFALGKSCDVFLGISTSGNSENIVLAAKTAKSLGMKTIALTGCNGGKLAEICDVTVKAPENETYKVQELHLPIYHAICAQCEKILFGE